MVTRALAIVRTENTTELPSFLFFRDSSRCCTILCLLGPGLQHALIYSAWVEAGRNKLYYTGSVARPKWLVFVRFNEHITAPREQGTQLTEGLSLQLFLAGLSNPNLDRTNQSATDFYTGIRVISGYKVHFQFNGLFSSGEKLKTRKDLSVSYGHGYKCCKTNLL